MKKFVIISLALLLSTAIIANADNMQVVELTHNAAWEGTPEWSSDGTRIVFGSNRDNGNFIWAMDVDGGENSNLVQVTTRSGNPFDRSPCYQPGTDSIVFASMRNGGGLYKICEDGTNLHRINDDPGADLPDYSPDGVWITYHALLVSNTEIFKYNESEGPSSIVQLTTNGGSDDSPDFSPDGLSIAFASNRDGNFEIYTMDAGGESIAIEQLTFTETIDRKNRNPAFSPDGAYIGFSSSRSGQYELYYMDSRGENHGLVQLTINNQSNGGIAWSPTSMDSLVFNSNRHIQTNHDIYLGYELPIINDVGDEDDFVLRPRNYDLFQNYPNPFNPSTKIHFALPQSEHVILKVYNLMGQEVATLLDENIQAGSHDVDFDGRDLSSGVYFYILNAGDFIKSRKMTLVK
ncbi:MAG: T9SS type A sorting domain-containing protein [candidate division Zixibacteria bacterium]|nr:T9SS type A sorting domain-containing protein [candidate division Zixibacteria bacterium]